jgi:lysylphosphatidylglycerol synthetase-like protein (DUF2156 family)
MEMPSSVRELSRTAQREIGRVTLVRLTVYYICAGALLLLITGIFPQGAARPGQPAPPTDLGGALAWIRSELSLFPQGTPIWIDAVVQMVAATLLVLPIAFVYVRTRTRLKYDHSIIQTVIVLPLVVCAIVVVVRDSLALAFSLAGIVAAVRFRNNLKESGDAVYIFGSIGIGFATGIHAIGVAAALSVFFVLLELALWKFNFGGEFEQTFARLCMPSGADLAAIATATGEHQAIRPPKEEPEPDTEEPRRSKVVRVYVDQVEQARPLVEAVLQRDAKAWTLSRTQPSDGGPGILEYRVRPRKRVDLDTLRERLLREAAPHVVAADETSADE